MKVSKRAAIVSPGYYPLGGEEKPEVTEVTYYYPTKEQLKKAIHAGHRAKLRLMYGAGLFRQWQVNPVIGSKCWVIDQDMDIRLVTVRVNSTDFTRPYHNFMTFLTKKDALRTRAKLVRMLRDMQVELYANVEDPGRKSRRGSIQLELWGEDEKGLDWR